MTHERRFIPGGYILYARQFIAMLEGAPLLDRVLWTWLNCRANHRHNDRTSGRLRRGQLVTTLEDIARAMRWRQGYVLKQPSRSTVRRALVRLAERRLIVTRRTTRGLVITLCDYKTYQEPGRYERPSSDTPSGTTRASAAAPDRQEWKKNGKKGRAPRSCSSVSGAGKRRVCRTFEEMDRDRADQALSQAREEFLADDEA